MSSSRDTTEPDWRANVTNTCMTRGSRVALGVPSASTSRAAGRMRSPPTAKSGSRAKSTAVQASASVIGDSSANDRWLIGTEDCRSGQDASLAPNPAQGSNVTESLLTASARPSNPEPVTERPAGVRARSRFFLGMATILLVAVLAGFAPTFYLRVWFDAAPEAPRVWIHAVVLTAWFVVFWLQSMLVTRRQVAWHRQIGWVGAAIGVCAAVTSVHVTLAAVAAGTTIPRPVWSNLANATAFTAFVGAAIAWRRDPDTHKRLMLLASIAFVQPALARFFVWSPLAGLTYPVAGGMAMSLLLLLPLAAHDLATHKRLHPATLSGGLALVAIRVTAVFVIAPSSFGQSVMRWFA
jgi:hypothetical protein